MKKLNFKIFILSAALLFSIPRSASAIEYIVNGDFSANGSAWTSEGPVFFSGSSASLTDAGTIPGVCDGFQCSRIFQGVALTPDTYTLQFDFLSFLGPAADAQGNFVFPDFLAASLFLTDSATFLPDTPPADLPASPGPSLFAYQFDGASDVASGATLGASAIGGEWKHFSLNFTTSKGYAYVLFELFGLDFVAENASVLIDNVSISRNGGDPAVPEPATLGLFSIGALGALGFRKKVR